MASAQTAELRDAIAAVVREQVIAERREWRRLKRQQRVDRSPVSAQSTVWDEREPETRPPAA